jgi:hypothetical protein
MNKNIILSLALATFTATAAFTASSIDLNEELKKIDTEQANRNTTTIHTSIINVVDGLKGLIEKGISTADNFLNSYNALVTRGKKKLIIKKQLIDLIDAGKVDEVLKTLDNKEIQDLVFNKDEQANTTDRLYLYSINANVYAYLYDKVIEIDSPQLFEKTIGLDPEFSLDNPNRVQNLKNLLLGNNTELSILSNGSVKILKFLFEAVGYDPLNKEFANAAQVMLQDLKLPIKYETNADKKSKMKEIKKFLKPYAKQEKQQAKREAANKQA